MQHDKPIQEQFRNASIEEYRIDLSRLDIRIENLGSVLKTSEGFRAVGSRLEYKNEEGQWVLMTGVMSVAAKINPTAKVYEVIAWVNPLRCNAPKEFMKPIYIESGAKV